MWTSPPNPGALVAALSPFAGRVYRARTADYPDPFDAAGSLLEGGRYNPRALFSVLYCSLDPWIASLEVLDHHPDGVDQLIVYELRVSLLRVLDLRNPEVPAALTAGGGPQLMPLDFTESDLRLPVAVAALALASGADGLLVPSAAWARYEDDLPVIETAPGIPRPLVDPGNIVVLRDDGLVRDTAIVHYRGAARLASSEISGETAPAGRAA